MDRLTAHLDYTKRVVRLMIWYVWHLSKCGNPQPIPDLLETYVDIMRKTSLFDGRHPAPSGNDGPVGLDPPIPQWDALKAELAMRIAAHGGPDTARLEDACWSLLEPYIDPKMQEAPAAEHPYECWNYNVLEQSPNIINLQSGFSTNRSLSMNASAPRSRRAVLPGTPDFSARQPPQRDDLFDLLRKLSQSGRCRRLCVDLDGCRMEFQVGDQPGQVTMDSVQRASSTACGR
jgi:hypothetical protein